MSAKKKPKFNLTPLQAIVIRNQLENISNLKKGFSLIPNRAYRDKIQANDKISEATKKILLDENLFAAIMVNIINKYCLPDVKISIQKNDETKTPD